MRAPALFLRSIAQRMRMMIRRPSATTTMKPEVSVVVDQHDSDNKKKQTKNEIVTTVVLKGYEASHIKTLLPSLRQELSASVALKTALQNLPPALKNKIRVASYSQVHLRGFLASEVEVHNLPETIQQYTNHDEDDADHVPKGLISNSSTTNSLKFTI